MRHRHLVVALVAASSFALAARQTANPAPQVGIREAAWSPDSKRLAVSWFDVIWTMTPDGKDAKRLVAKPGEWMAERDPAWSPDGKSIAFSTAAPGGFDLWIAAASGGAARHVTSLAGDERWPSFTPDGRIVFSHRDPGGP